nr:MAG TPA_asm: Cytosine specific methyltransferase [Caudoviricetes sp.]
MDGQVSLFALDTSYGRTCQARSAATKGGTSRQSSKRSSASSNRKPPVLMCLQRVGRLGEDTTTAWVDDGAWLGECMTRNTGECPNVAVESRLSQILEATPPAKYSLTAKACLGILRRAERRGKDLPKLLKAVLIRQSQGASPQEQTEAPAPTEAPTSYAVRIRGGCDGGGKGALVQTEKSGTLGTGNDQTIFAAIPINDKATRWQGGGESRNHDGSGNGLGIGRDGDPSPTLTAGDRHGVMAVALDMTHACDVIRECGEQVSALQARMGTGGNQVPLTYGIGNGQAHEASIMTEEVSQTLNTMHDAQAILSQPKSAMEENWAESETKNALRAGESKVSHAVMCEDVSHALRAKAACAYREDAETYPVQNMVVRRLTPMECERLQGFPNHWTDIGEWTDEKGKEHKDADSPRYKALGNSIALPFWEWMLRRMARYLPERATLGSLFDGIGGFPLCWERIHGQRTARWASEIEQFPVAVTKIRFPEEGEEDGI